MVRHKVGNVLPSSARYGASCVGQANGAPGARLRSSSCWSDRAHQKPAPKERGNLRGLSKSSTVAATMADEERLVDLARRLEAGIEVVRRKTSNSLKLRAGCMQDTTLAGLDDPARLCCWQNMEQARGAGR